MNFDKNEPAFPCPEASVKRYGHSDGFMGMDIRTTIATKMMQGLLSNQECILKTNNGHGLSIKDCTKKQIAEFSVSLADMLIEELNK